MLRAMLAEGLGVFGALQATVERRLEQGLAREEFLRAMALAAIVSCLGALLPELNGVSAAVDRVMGAESPESSLREIGLVIWIMAVATALVCWKGPQIAARLSALFGGTPDLRSGAIWIYLATAASVAVTVLVGAVDLVMGLLLERAPKLAGTVSLSASLVGSIAALAASASLARRINGVPGNWRAILMTVAWLICLFGVGLATGLPLLSLIG